VITMKMLKKGINFMGKSVKKFFLRLSDPSIILFSTLILIFSLAVIIRSIPLKWGLFLTEFDPYYEYYLAKKTLERGVLWWFQYSPSQREFDTLFWYPYGRDLRRTSQPGVPILVTLIYIFLKTIGLTATPLAIHAFLPVVMSGLSVPCIYLLCRKAFNSYTGLLAALILSINTALLGSTTLGNVHDGMIIPLMLLTFYFMLKGFEGKPIIWSVLAGLSLGLIVLIWGGFLYVWNLVALYFLVLYLTNNLDRNMAETYIIIDLIAKFFIIITPRHGIRVALTSLYALLPLVTLVACTYYLLLEKLGEERFKGATFRLLIVVAAGLLVIAGYYTGFFAKIAGRIMAIIIPSERNPIIESVGEHRIPTWSMIFLDYNVLLIFSLFGLYILLRKRKVKDILILLLYLSSLYATSSMSRLSILFSPACAILASVGFFSLADKLYSMYKGEVILPRKRLQEFRREHVVLTFIVVTLILVTSFVTTNALDYCHQPALILTSSLPMRDTSYESIDWISALEWMRENLPEDAVIACWWDYGYWISVNTNRSTLADNGTLNTTQIAEIARAFLSNETEALKIFHSLGATHVVVFEPFRSLQGYDVYGMPVYFPDPYGHGDFGKSYWMAKIGGLDPDKYQYVTTGQLRGLLIPANNKEALSATLYKLLFVKTDRRRLYIFEPLVWNYFPSTWWSGNPIYSIESPKYFELIYASYPNNWVLVFRINYEKANMTSPTRK